MKTATADFTPDDEGTKVILTEMAERISNQFEADERGWMDTNDVMYVIAWLAARWSNDKALLIFLD